MKTHPLPNYIMLPTTHLLVTLLPLVKLDMPTQASLLAGLPPSRLKSGLASEKWLASEKMALERKIADFPIKPRFHKMSFGTLSNNLIERMDLTYHCVTSLYDMTFGFFPI